MSTPDKSIDSEKSLIDNQPKDLSSVGDAATEIKNSSKSDTTISKSTVIKDRYQIISLIGQGGMGQVYLAQDLELERRVAVKRIKTLNDATVRRFLVEAKSVAKISHYHVVHIYDFGQDSQGPFLILEYVDGGTLADLLKAGPLPADQSIRIICQLAEGLGKAHDLGIIHRDIKPANILMTKDGQPKLTDFGLAQVDGPESMHTASGAVLGTFNYMPPEQQRSATLTDARSDLWSLAATFYQMVTGKSPRTIKFNLLPVNLQEFVGKALEDDPADRYQTANEFLKALSGQNAITYAQAKQENKTQSNDLQTGECISCHTVNETNRKFCRKCAKPLRTNCLKCEEEIPVWDNICGECGGNQAEIIRKLEQGYSDLATGCNILISNNEFFEAHNIIDQLKKLDKFRFAQFIDHALELEGKLEKAKSDFQQKKLNDLELKIRNNVREINEKKSSNNQSMIINTIDLTNEYLELNPDHEKIRKLHQSLLSRKVDPGGTRKLIQFQDFELAFRWCPPGKFLMGSPETEKGRYDIENQASVTLSQGFWMMETVVTQKLWLIVTGERLDWTKNYGLGDNHPAYNVDWKMAVDFCKNFTDKLQSSGLIPSELQLTLPTEAQWEYACRAGTQTAYSFGDDPSKLGDYAWYENNSNEQTHAVGQKKPNVWGLYDMHGNVWEWTADAYNKKHRGGVDPYLAGDAGSIRVFRGGGWYRDAAYCRSAFRCGDDPSYRYGYLGFRLALSPSR